MLRRLARWLQPIFLVLAITAIAWFISSQWTALRTYPWRLNWGWLSLTVLLTLASWALEIAIWRRLLLALGAQLPYWTATRIWFLSAIVRYIPGNIWQPLSLTLYGRRHGVAPEISLTSIVLFQVLTLLAVLPILVVYFLWIDTKSLAAHFVAYLPPATLWLALIPVIIFFLRPSWLERILNWGLAKLHRPSLSIHLTSSLLVALTFLTMVDWLLWGSVFASFTFAVAGNIGASAGQAMSSVALVPLLVASFPIASIIGFLSLITPSGFGVREGAFYLLLTPQIAGSVVAVIALGIRVWGIVCELIAASISAPIEKMSLRTRSNAPASSDEGAVLREPSVREAVVTADLRRETL